MKRGLSYIVMAVFCGLCFSSCAKDELAAKAGGTEERRYVLHCLFRGILPERLTRPQQMVIGIYHSGTGDYCGRRCVCTSD